MQVPFLSINVARRCFPELTFERLAELSGAAKLDPRTVLNVLTGATEARDDTDEGFFNILEVLVDEGKVPAFDRSLAKIECYRRKRYEALSDDIAGGKCNIDRLRDFLVTTGCPSLEPLRQRTWDQTSTASYARYYGADLRYDGVKAMPNQLGEGKVWLGNDKTLLRESAKLYWESFDGFRQIDALVEAAVDLEKHEVYFEYAKLLALSMMTVTASNLVGFAVEAEDEGWNGFPGIEEVGEKLRSTVSSRAEAVVLANRLLQLFSSSTWKSRIKFNQACALLAMICLSEDRQYQSTQFSRERVAIISELRKVGLQLPQKFVDILSTLPTASYAMRRGLLTANFFKAANQKGL